MPEAAKEDKPYETSESARLRLKKDADKKAAAEKEKRDAAKAAAKKKSNGK